MEGGAWLRERGGKNGGRKREGRRSYVEMEDKGISDGGRWKDGVENVIKGIDVNVPM